MNYPQQEKAISHIRNSKDPSIKVLTIYKSNAFDHITKE